MAQPGKNHTKKPLVFQGENKWFRFLFGVCHRKQLTDQRVVALKVVDGAARVAAVFADEGDMVFTKSSITDAKVGDTVTVTASVKNARICASFRVIFTYDDTVLKVESGKKADAKGLFMINTKAEHEGKKAVNALAADASKALEVADRAYVLETGNITLQGTGIELAKSDEVRKAYLGG